MRLDHVALTDLTHLRIFPRNLAPDFTHYLTEQLEISTHDEESQKPKTMKKQTTEQL